MPDKLAIAANKHGEVHSRGEIGLCSEVAGLWVEVVGLCSGVTGLWVEVGVFGIEVLVPRDEAMALYGKRAQCLSKAVLLERQPGGGA